MSEMKTTPGPWETERVTAGGTLRVVASDAAGSPSVALIISQQTDEYEEANARLIASAPTMLSALKAMDEALTKGWGNPESFAWPREAGCGVPEAWIQIRSAISRAEAR